MDVTTTSTKIGKFDARFFHMIFEEEFAKVNIDIMNLLLQLLLNINHIRNNIIIIQTHLLIR